VAGHVADDQPDPVVAEREERRTSHRRRARRRWRTDSPPRGPVRGRREGCRAAQARCRVSAMVWLAGRGLGVSHRIGQEAGRIPRPPFTSVSAKGGPLGVAGQSENPDRALPGHHRRGQHAVGPQTGEGYCASRWAVPPISGSRAGAPRQNLAGPGGVGDLNPHRADRGDLVAAEFPRENAGPIRITVGERGGVQGAFRGRHETRRSDRPDRAPRLWAAVLEQFVPVSGWRPRNSAGRAQQET